MKGTLHYTLITGASQGIGKAIAEECARLGRSLVLVALDEPQLEEVARDIRDRYGITVHYLGVDLALEGGPARVWRWAQENSFVVDTLINNAGFGRNGIYESRPLAEYEAMVRLNVQAMVSLIHLFLPAMRQLPRAYILNMSSMEAALPLPFKAVYSGTKHFVYGFSLALREELKEDGISVSVVCPGPVITNEDSLKRIRTQGAKAKLIVLFPDQVARAAIRGLLAGRQMIIPGRTAYVVSRLGRLFPASVKMPILARLFRAYREG